MGILNVPYSVVNPLLKHSILERGESKKGQRGMFTMPTWGGKKKHKHTHLVGVININKYIILLSRHSSKFVIHCNTSLFMQNFNQGCNMFLVVSLVGSINFNLYCLSMLRHSAGVTIIIIMQQQQT